jgi:hypothetical protein
MRVGRGAAKVGLVAAGYLGAFVLASAVVTAHIAATSGADRQLYSVMFGFGDDLLFLAVFGVAAVVPFGTALFFLRPYPSFWRLLSVTALVLAATAGAMFFIHVAPRPSDGPSPAAALLALAGLLRTLISPFLALACLVATVIAPSRRPRLALLAATAVEALALLWSRSPGSIVFVCPEAGQGAGC